MVDDWAPGHLADKDSPLKKADPERAAVRKEKRISAVKELRALRAIIPRKGAPRAMANDRLHRIARADVKEGAQEMIGKERGAR